MLRSLFGRNRKRKGIGATGPAQDDSIRSVKVGDVLSIQGLAFEYDDRYFYVEKIHRYANEADTWYELTCVDGDTHIWIDWTDGYELLVTATDDPDPVGLGSIELTEEQLMERATRSACGPLCELFFLLSLRCRARSGQVSLRSGRVRCWDRVLSVKLRCSCRSGQVSFRRVRLWRGLGIV